MEQRLTAAAAILIALLLCVIAYQNVTIHAQPYFSTPFQAVLLQNGQAFFGQLDKANTDYPVLRNVFYIRSQINQETKQVNNQLVKRGQEWHEPDYMVLNRSHIVLIEPVRPGSQVAKLIDEASKSDASKADAVKK